MCPKSQDLKAFQSISDITFTTINVCTVWHPTHPLKSCVFFLIMAFKEQRYFFFPAQSYTTRTFLRGQQSECKTSSSLTLQMFKPERIYTLPFFISVWCHLDRAWGAGRGGSCENPCRRQGNRFIHCKTRPAQQKLSTSVKLLPEAECMLPAVLHNCTGKRTPEVNATFLHVTEQNYDLQHQKGWSISLNNGWTPAATNDFL